jgi:hypothetical protein
MGGLSIFDGRQEAQKMRKMGQIGHRRVLKTAEV